MMTEDCCAIFFFRPCSPDWLISGKRVWPIDCHPRPPFPPFEKCIYTIYGTMKRDTVHKTQHNTLLSANLQPEGHEQLQILNLQESTKKKKKWGEGGWERRQEKNKIKTPLRRNHDTTGIKTIPGLQLKRNNNNRKKNGPGDEWVTATQLGQDEHCGAVLPQSIRLQSMCSNVQRDINSVH